MRTCRLVSCHETAELVDYVIVAEPGGENDKSSIAPQLLRFMRELPLVVAEHGVSRSYLPRCPSHRKGIFPKEFLMPDSFGKPLYPGKSASAEAASLQHASTFRRLKLACAQCRTVFISLLRVSRMVVARTF